MPPNAHMTGMDDAALAGLMTYLRRSWGNKGDAVSVAGASAIRAASADRTRAWTAAELQQVPFDRGYQRCMRMDVVAGRLSSQAIIDEVNDDFAIGFGLKPVAFGQQSIFELPIVFDHAVVGDRDAFFAAAMRMSVGMTRRAVSRPARMPDADRCVVQRSIDSLGERFDPADGFGEGQFAGMLEKQSQTLTGVISTLKGSLQELGNALAKDFLPFLTATVSKITELVNMVSGAREMKTVFAELFQSGLFQNTRKLNDDFLQFLSDDTLGKLEEARDKLETLKTAQGELNRILAKAESGERKLFRPDETGFTSGKNVRELRESLATIAPLQIQLENMI